DPYRWIPEAARLLRPGGELIFLVNGTFLMLCAPDLDSEGPATDRLRRDYFGMHRFEWADAPTVEFHLGYGDWIRLLRSNGFEVVELRRYELMLNLPAEADDRVIGAVTDRIGQVLSRSGGQIAKADRWGRRRLAYPIDKLTEGYYLLVECVADPADIKELDRV